MRNLYKNIALGSYIKVYQIDHNNNKVKLVRKSKCNQHEALYYRMISLHKLVTF
jgi:hypothetical protein